LWTRLLTIAVAACEGALVYAFFLTIFFVMALGFINMFTPYGANWEIGIIVLPIVTGAVVGASVRGLTTFLGEGRPGTVTSNWLTKTSIIAAVLLLDLLPVSYILRLFKLI
jgi:hypothetical protein